MAVFRTPFLPTAWSTSASRSTSHPPARMSLAAATYCSGQRKDHSLNCPVPLEYWVSPPKFLWSSYERRGDALGFHVAPWQFFFASSERPKIEQSPLIYESPPRLKIRVPFTSFTSPRFTFECQHGTRLSGPPHAWDVPLVFTAFEPCKMRVVYHSFWFTAGKQSRSIRLSANHVDLQLTKAPTCRRSPSMRRPRLPAPRSCSRHLPAWSAGANRITGNRPARSSSTANGIVPTRRCLDARQATPFNQLPALGSPAVLPRG